MDVAAYELRTHYGATEERSESSGDQMRTIYKMFTDTGLDEVVGQHPGLVTLTSDALAEDNSKITRHAGLSGFL